MTDTIPESLPDYLAPLWKEAAEQCKNRTPAVALEVLVRQMHLLRDAERRVTEEGAVVVDGKGRAVEHPAIKIQREAGKEIREWLLRYGS